jgi:hypothetical protein
MEAISFIYVSVDKQCTKELVTIRSSSPAGLLSTWWISQYIRGFVGVFVDMLSGYDVTDRACKE